FIYMATKTESEAALTVRQLDRGASHSCFAHIEGRAIAANAAAQHHETNLWRPQVGSIDIGEVGSDLTFDFARRRARKHRHCGAALLDVGLFKSVILTCRHRTCEKLSIRIDNS